MRISAFLQLSASFVLLARTAMGAPTGQTFAPPAAAEARVDASSAAAKPHPEPIAVSMIALQAEATSIRVRRIKIEMEKVLMIEDVEGRLKAVTGSLQRFRPLLEAGELPQLEELVNLRQELKRLSLQLIAVQANLTPRSQNIEARREELLKTELLWKTTFDTLNLRETPRTTRELIIAVQREIQGGLSVIASSRSAMLTLQGRISEQRIAVDNLLVQTDDAIKESEGSVLAIDSKPLWQAVAAARLSTSVSESIRAFSQRRALPLSDYLRDDKGRLGAHLLIFLLLASLLIGVSQNSRTWFDRREAGSARVLRHPVAAAAVLSLLLSFNIYPNAPITLYRLPLLLMVIPLLRLLSAVPGRDERRMFCFLTGIYLLRLLDEMAASDDFLHRIFLLLLTSLAILGVCLAAKADYRAASAGLGPWRRVRTHLVRLAGVILVVSLIANIVGSVGLSTRLANGCISSAFGGAALYVGVLTLEGYLNPLLQSPLVHMFPAIHKYRELFQERISFLVRLGALTIWAWTTLRLFGLSGPILSMINPVLIRQWSFGRMTFSLGGILLFAVTIWLSALTARFIGFLLEEDILPRLSLPQGMPATVSMLVRDSVIALGFILALAGAGLQWSQIVLVASAIGVGVGLGLQNLVASFVAGLILIFERPIRVGDEVEIGKISGIVVRIGLRSSSIRTYDGSEVICPNSNLISQELVNWTLSNQPRRLEVQVRAAYGSNAEKVLEVLTKVARNHPGVLPEPEPIALFKGFGDGSLNFVLRCFCSFNDWLVLQSEVGVRVNEALREAGIEIPLPQRDIRITSAPSKTMEPRKLERMTRST